MSWYDEDWTKRWPVVCKESLSTTAARDVQIELPSEWPEFWGNVQSAGQDIRITDSDGAKITGAAYQLVGFNSTTRTGIIQIDDHQPPTANGYYVLWIYFGNSTVASAATAFTYTSADSGAIHPGATVPPVVSAGPAAPGVKVPPETVAKTSKETIYVWFDLGNLLENLGDNYEGSTAYEEVAEIAFAVLNAGTDEAAEHDDTKLRLLPEGLVRTQVSTSAADVDRTLSLTLTTTLDRVLNPRALLKVRDPDET